MKKVFVVIFGLLIFSIVIVVLLKPFPCHQGYFCHLAGCVKDGEFLPEIGPYSPQQLLKEPTSCCFGLKRLRDKSMFSDDCKILIKDGGVSSFCTANCGNGRCGELESKCNCPSDCKE